MHNPETISTFEQENRDLRITNHSLEMANKELRAEIDQLKMDLESTKEYVDILESRTKIYEATIDSNLDQIGLLKQLHRDTLASVVNWREPDL